MVTISTPDSATPICRVGSAEEILGDLTVRQLIERVISPKSLLSVQIPISQLEAEKPTAATIAELLAGSSCEVVLAGDSSGLERVVGLDEPAAGITAPQVGPQGTAFLNIVLEVRPTSTLGRAATERKRQQLIPEAAGRDRLEASAPLVPGPGNRQVPPTRTPTTAQAESANSDRGAVPAAKAAAAAGPAVPGSQAGERRQVRVPETVEGAPGGAAVRPAPAGREKKGAGYARKMDWLRAHFQPEIQALDLSGLFVGNLGLGVREARERRQVLLADPTRITDILLRGNSYRRGNDHASALACYQQLVDMDPSNPDFHLLLGKTLLALGQEAKAAEALARAKELGHEGARKELEAVNSTPHRARGWVEFLRFGKR